MPGIAGGIIIALIGYLWGSVPAGYWMGKLLRGKDFDIRDYGSHKIGATNVLRTLGRFPAIIVFLFDISKGVGPTLLAKLPVFYLSGWGLTIAALAALIGHCYPVFIGFKGGRGVATGAGAILVISPCLPDLRDYHAQYHCHLALRFSRLHRWRPDLDYLWPHLFLRRPVRLRPPAATGLSDCWPGPCHHFPLR